MSLTGKLVSQIDIKSDGDVFHEILKNSTHDGQGRVEKETIEAIDEATKSVKYKVIAGDLLKLYNTFSMTVHVDNKGDDHNLVTWTLDYEKKDAGVPDPNTLMEFCLKVTKDIETQHLK